MPLGNEGARTSKNPWKSLKIKTLLKISKILAFIICRNRSSPMYLWLKWYLLVLDQSRLLGSGEGIILIKYIAGFYAYAPNLWERLILEMHERSGYVSRRLLAILPLHFDSDLGEAQEYHNTFNRIDGVYNVLHALKCLAFWIFSFLHFQQGLVLTP